MAQQKIEMVGFGEDALPYTLPPQPPKKEIEYWDLPKKEQKWKRPIFPSEDDFEALPANEQAALIEREFNRRIYGYWFYNNGIPTYITGSHYFYLAYWYIAAPENDGYPAYREANRKFFYFQDICEKDPNCFGYIAMTPKRYGKTEIALAEQYNIATLIERDSLFGIQALTHTEAKGLFKDRVLRSHRRIPSYLRAYSNDDIKKGEITAELTFKGDMKKGSKSTFALNNIINHRPTTESAYQGKRPRKIFLDEAGTVEEMDLMDWWTTVKQQLAIGTKRIFGKAALPATLENITNKGAQYFSDLWEQSNQHKKNENGRTESGLYRYFNPFFQGYEGTVDEYGFDDEEAAKKFRENELKSAKSGTQAKIKRQYPASVEEAFDVIRGDVWEPDAKEALVEAKVEAINHSLDIIGYRLSMTKEGTIDKKVVSEKYFHESIPKTGRDVLWVLEPPQPNAVYRIGVDGTGSDKQTGGEQGSNFAFVVLKGFAGMEGESYTAVAHFNWRPSKMDSALTQLLCTAQWYNAFGQCKVLGETNQGGGSFALDFFARKGFRHLLMPKPKSLATKDASNTYWLFRSVDVKDWQFRLANRFLPLYGRNNKMFELTDQLIGYNNEGNFDLVDAWLMALLAHPQTWEKSADDPEVKKKRPPKMRRKLVNRNGAMIYEWVEVHPPIRVGGITH